MAAECRKRDGTGHKLFAHHQMNVSRESPLELLALVGRHKGGFSVPGAGWGPLDEMVGFGTWKLCCFWHVDVVIHCAADASFARLFGSAGTNRWAGHAGTRFFAGFSGPGDPGH